MVRANWELFTERWLLRAERGRVFVDDGDRFISLWIAFNGWMKRVFGEALNDSMLLRRLKHSEKARVVFEDLKTCETSFNESLRELSKYAVADMRHLEDQTKVWKFDGSFESLINVLYRVRCNLFHGRKDVNANNKDIELVSLAYRILLPLLKACLSIQF